MALPDSPSDPPARSRKRERQATFADLPLFASERDISIALMGPGRYSEWRAVAPLLERRGFPTLDGLMGGASRVLPAAQRARTPKEIN